MNTERHGIAVTDMTKRRELMLEMLRAEAAHLLSDTCTFVSCFLALSHILTCMLLVLQSLGEP